MSCCTCRCLYNPDPSPLLYELEIWSALNYLVIFSLVLQCFTEFVKTKGWSRWARGHSIFKMAVMCPGSRPKLPMFPILNFGYFGQTCVSISVPLFFMLSEKEGLPRFLTVNKQLQCHHYIDQIATRRFVDNLHSFQLLFSVCIGKKSGRKLFNPKHKQQHQDDYLHHYLDIPAHTCFLIEFFC